MAANAEEQREDELYESEYPFIKNAQAIIRKMIELNLSSQNKKELLVDEILHSIFFLGMINAPPFSPEDIFTDSEMLGALRLYYPLPFQHYSSQLPRRTPFSCVLDMIVFLEGRENEEEIKQKLQEIITELHLKKMEPLVSSTICVSQKNPNSEKYYGVSMSTSGRDPGRIMVAASCLPGSWDSYVAGAVMTFNPKKRMRSYFDGTIKLPEPVTCKAYSLHGGGPVVPPCKSCRVVWFGRKDMNEFPYGNCAEVESVSNLFKNDKEVREQARPTSEKVTTKNRSKAEKSVREDLRNLLKTFKLPCDYHFYIPSE
ncbi:3-dehydroquinate synthase [Dissostichus eleginoides]|uniref:3-dehydroquinate synthase n=1 Tax=Dissostichus eleginoides TaxID=100907 RepID=A0AAD9BDE8_DISEL|nr:3-dehydroquinate synthase [Dissostichus eleginoides]